MNRYYYDLHVHSCLSPCGDDDNTPNNIAGMAFISGINILALTDHNTCKNCPSFFEAAGRYGIIPVAGMELTTSEDIHVVCLFEHLSDAMRFDEAINEKRILIKNRKDIFGEQLILDEEDNVIGEEEYLLTNATSISIEDVPELVSSFGGICYPAHIDRESNGIIAVLGTLPETPRFRCVELHDKDRFAEYESKYNLKDKTIIFSSDAHYLDGISDGTNYFDLEADKNEPCEVRKKLFELLRR